MTKTLFSEKNVIIEKRKFKTRLSSLNCKIKLKKTDKTFVKYNAAYSENIAIIKLYKIKHKINFKKRFYKVYQK